MLTRLDLTAVRSAIVDRTAFTPPRWKPSVDGWTHEFTIPEFVVLCGGGGSGRTSLAYQLARDAAAKFGSSMILSGVLDARHLGERMVAACAGVPIHHIRHELQDRDRELLAAWKPEDEPEVRVMFPPDLPEPADDRLFGTALLVIDDADAWLWREEDLPRTLHRLSQGSLVIATVPRETVFSADKVRPEWRAAADLILELQQVVDTPTGPVQDLTLHYRDSVAMETRLVPEFHLARYQGRSTTWRDIGP